MLNPEPYRRIAERYPLTEKVTQDELQAMRRLAADWDCLRITWNFMLEKVGQKL